MNAFIPSDRELVKSRVPMRSFGADRSQQEQQVGDQKVEHSVTDSSRQEIVEGRDEECRELVSGDPHMEKVRYVRETKKPRV